MIVMGRKLPLWQLLFSCPVARPFRSHPINAESGTFSLARSLSHKSPPDIATAPEEKDVFGAPRLAPWE